MRLRRFALRVHAAPDASSHVAKLSRYADMTAALLDSRTLYAAERHRQGLLDEAISPLKKFRAARRATRLPPPISMADDRRISHCLASRGYFRFRRRDASMPSFPAATLSRRQAYSAGHARRGFTAMAGASSTSASRRRWSPGGTAAVLQLSEKFIDDSRAQLDYRATQSAYSQFISRRARV